MSDPVGWQCRDCDAVGDTPGSAAAHLQDRSLDEHHTVDFLDADGETVGSITGPEMEAADAEDAQAAAGLAEAPEAPDPGPVMLEIAMDAAGFISGALEALQLAADPVDIAQLVYVQLTAERLGPDATIRPCPSCEGRGYRLGELRVLPGFERCPDCDGEGRGLTDSRTPGHLEETCGSCQGKGWRRVGTVAQLPPTGNQPAPMAGKPTPPPGYVWTADGSELVKLG